MKNFYLDLAIASKWSHQLFTDLPWRRQRSFYLTLVSEIMLQQTTVSTVKNRFDDFIKKYPDLKKLADAKEDELLQLWQGLGYYNRARRLRSAAQMLVSFKQSQFSVFELLKIKGIGDYTANALMAIGLNQPALAIDVNIERVLIRYLGPRLIKKVKVHYRDQIKNFFEKNLKKKLKNYRSFHETLMDVGRVFCQARSRNCLQCPMKNGCFTFKNNKDYFEKFKKTKIKKTEKVEIARLVIFKNKKFLLKKRSSGQWLSGQWEVPSYILKGEIDEKQYQKIQFSLKNLVEICTFKSTITNHEFTNRVIQSKEVKNYEGHWFSLDELDKIPITSITKKIFTTLKKSQEERKPGSVL